MRLWSFCAYGSFYYHFFRRDSTIGRSFVDKPWLSRSRNQGLAFELTAELKKILPGFDYFKFESMGKKHRLLKAFFKREGESVSEGYGFEELSDGERMLIALYSLLYFFRSEFRALLQYSGRIVLVS